MLKELLANLWQVKRECSYIIIIFAVLTFFANCAQIKGIEKAITAKIERWEKNNYHLTEYRKNLIMKACAEDFGNADDIINRLGSEQKNFDR